MSASSNDWSDRKRLALIVGALLVGSIVLTPIHAIFGPEIRNLFTLLGLFVSVYALYLFYRLVVAVERIANKL
ncbi:hypothetical protein [Natronorubrum sp. FCH18a]|uniref:hypothetical protein n=1 Tax=Natronorubrum sp. FCH18a TaxID=3447018 RepID=UPI003F519367